MIWSGLWWFGVVCVGLCSGLWWFVVVCSGLWWFVVFSATRFSDITESTQNLDND